MLRSPLAGCAAPAASSRAAGERAALLPFTCALYNGCAARDDASSSNNRVSGGFTPTVGTVQAAKISSICPNYTSGKMLLTPAAHTWYGYELPWVVGQRDTVHARAIVFRPGCGLSSSARRDTVQSCTFTRAALDPGREEHTFRFRLLPLRRGRRVCSRGRTLASLREASHLRL